MIQTKKFVKRVIFGFIIVICTGISLTNSFAADPSPSPTNSGTSNTNSSLIPNYRDPEIPQIQGLNTSVSKVDGQLTVLAELSVRIRSNTLNYIEINLLPKTSTGAVNPKLIPPCVKLGSIKATSTNVGGDMQTLQSRSQTPDKWYLERHVVSTVLKLPPVTYPTATPTYQDLCDGQYVVSTIILKDAAGKTLTITANAASTASISTSTTAQARNKFTDNAIMQTDFWTDGFAMPCSPGSNLAPVTSSSTVNGRTTTTTATPTTPVTVRVPCNQTLDFNKVYISVGPGPGGATSSSGSSSLPIVDYAGQAKEMTSVNKRLTNQIEILEKQVANLQGRILIYQRGGKPAIDTSTAEGTLPLVDYRAKANALQKKVDELTAQLAKSIQGKKPATSGNSLKQTKKPAVTASSPKPSLQSQSGQNTRGSRRDSGNSRSANTPFPRATSSPR